MARSSKVPAFLLAILSLSLCNNHHVTSFVPSPSRLPSSSDRSPSPIPTVPGPASLSVPVTLLFRRGSSVNSVPNGGENSSPFVYDRVDGTALCKYSAGIVTQMSLLFGLFTALDRILAHFSSFRVPFAANVLFLYAFNLKSSFFSILPSSSSEERYTKRNVPSWTPPGIAFVLGWPLLTFGLRAVTGAMVVRAGGGTYASAALMSLMLHLCVGNLWNTVNNVERRLGVSVVLLCSLWLTKAFAALQFYKVEPLAGKLLALTLTWITAAAALATRTWQINPDPYTGELEPLVPMKHPRWTTKFRWEK